MNKRHVFTRRDFLKRRSPRWPPSASFSPQEYFAESTEAFFSRNDFFPFTRAELKQHDPAIFQLLEKIWHAPAARETKSK
jgi:Mlc titration factor MtfA (ptsG expression regulator)